MRWLKQVFIHTRLSRAYLTLARLSCSYLWYFIINIWCRLSLSFLYKQVYPQFAGLLVVYARTSSSVSNHHGIQLRQTISLEAAGHRRVSYQSGSNALALTFGGFITDCTVCVSWLRIAQNKKLHIKPAKSTLTLWSHWERRELKGHKDALEFCICVGLLLLSTENNEWAVVTVSCSRDPL